MKSKQIKINFTLTEHKLRLLARYLGLPATWDASALAKVAIVSICRSTKNIVDIDK